MRRIIVVTEKHGTRYFAADTKDQLHASALKILSERLTDGYWYAEPEKPTQPVLLSDEQIAMLPKDSSTRIHAEDERKVYRRAVRNYEEDLLRYNAIRKAVADKDGAAAWKVLQSRTDHEYEGCDLETLEE